MRQVLQNLKNGEVSLAEIPVPRVRLGHLLIETRRSLVSIGTERMLLAFGQGNLLTKARSQPEKVKQVFEKIQTDGLLPTAKAVLSKLDQPMPLGYSNVGVVIAVGTGVSGFSVGDRVVSNGPHGEVVCIPRNLCAKIPSEVSDEQAAFTVTSAIALEGVRLAEPTLGETVVVMGLGLVGILAVQILVANGCRVIGFDLDPVKVKLAEALGAETFVLSSQLDPVKTVYGLTEDFGADAVLIAASTKSDDPIHQAPSMCRKRGRVVLTGDVGLHLMRSDFYKKEISFRVSCSYGPGRYDPLYEEKGLDYPIGFVRWTEGRNFQAVLELMRTGRLRVENLITHRIPLADAPSFYEKLTEARDALGVILDYPGGVDLGMQVVPLSAFAQRRAEGSKVALGIVGAGNFTSSVLLPAFKKQNVDLRMIASQGGVTGRHLGEKYKVRQVTSNYETILASEDVNTVLITTRHDTHARFALEALRAGKNVFVEKPLCLREEELEEIEAFYRETADSKQPLLMVGFNRRFSPLVKKLKALTDEHGRPLSMVMTVNAGFVPSDSWVQDPEAGGGRLLGEGCHFVDLLRFIAGARIVHSSVEYMESTCNDTFSIQLAFANGSIGTVHYFANGNKKYPKERLEVFFGEKILTLNNFRSLEGVGISGFQKVRLASQDKGHASETRAFVEAIEQGKDYVIPVEELFEVSRVCIDLAKRA